jgi:hypothetical protein
MPLNDWVFISSDLTYYYYYRLTVCTANSVYNIDNLTFKSVLPVPDKEPSGRGVQTHVVELTYIVHSDPDFSGRGKFKFRH